MDHSFIHSSLDGHLGCFHVLNIVNSATVNIGAYCSCEGFPGDAVVKKSPAI